MGIKLPVDEQSEFAVIGCCIAGGAETTADALEAAPAAAFMREDCQQALAVLTGMLARQAPINLVSFGIEWKKLHQCNIPTDIAKSPDLATPGMLQWHIDSIMDAWRRRKLIYAGDEMIKKAQEATESVDSIIAEAESHLDFEDPKAVVVSDGKVTAQLLIDALERRFNLKGQRSGLTTGFHRFDELTDGLQFGEATILAARPSVGKSAFVMNVVERVCMRDKQPTLFVSLEMSREELLIRLISSMSNITLTDLRRGAFTQEQLNKFASFKRQVEESKLLMIEALGGLNTHQLAGAVRRTCRKHGVKLVVIDYLQKVKAAGKYEKRTYEIAEVSGGLKALAKQTGAALLVVAQLNRESEKEKSRIPRLSDLAHSGQIEFDADTVALLHRDFANTNGKKGMVIVAKQRNGDVGKVDLDWDGAYCRFLNPTVEENPYEE